MMMIWKKKDLLRRWVFLKEKYLKIKIVFGLIDRKLFGQE